MMLRRFSIVGQLQIVYLDSKTHYLIVQGR